MSYILEALKKADQERGIGAVPNLATPHEIKHPQSRSWRWLWVVVTLLVVNVALLVMLLNGRDAEVPTAIEAPVEGQPTLTKDRPAQKHQPAGEETIREAPAPIRTVPPENVRTHPAGKLVVLPEPSGLQSSSPSLPPLEAPDRQMDAATTATDIAQLPSWYELPLQFRSSLSLPRLDLHVYSEQRQDRFIMVNLKKYREGERLESGLLLEEIFPDGMVMSYRGERFLVEK